MVIEDDAAVAASFQRQLQLSGFRVDCAADGQTGLGLARTNMYDVILLDRVLPKISGDRVLELLHKDGNPTPVVVVTGYPDTESAHRAGFLRAACYLEKGKITGGQLATAIQKAVRLARPNIDASTLPFSNPEHSDPFAGLTVYLGSREPLNRDELIRAFAKIALAPELTVDEFVVAARSIRLLNTKEHLPIPLIRQTILKWIAEGSSPLGSASDRQAQPAGEQELLMQRAARELVTSEDYVSQIAYSLGYSDQSNFDHDFKNYFGMSPRSFRRLF